MHEGLLSEPVSILMPVYNEIGLIEEVLTEWVDNVAQYLPPNSEMLFDDASTDGTEQVLNAWAQRHSFMKVHHLNQKDGFAAATRRLYLAAHCPLVFFTDSDGQYVAEDFWKLVPLIKDCDVVHGYKSQRQDPLYRVASSGLFGGLTRLMFHHSFHDINSAYRLSRREVVWKTLPLIRHQPTLLHAEMLLRICHDGGRIKELPIRHRQRQCGGSKGLPFNTYAVECFRAFKGLLALKAEYLVQSSH